MVSTSLLLGADSLSFLSGQAQGGRTAWDQKLSVIPGEPKDVAYLLVNTCVRRPRFELSRGSTTR